MSQQIKSGSCRASLKPCNVGAWLQHKIDNRADIELRVDPAVPESVELDEALCDVILDHAGACWPSNLCFTCLVLDLVLLHLQSCCKCSRCFQP